MGRPEPFRVGLNVFIYAAGKADYRNKLQTTVVPEPAENPVATTALARARYDGDWDPEPAAAGRFVKAFENDTSIRVAVTDVDADALEVHATPMALLTGTGNVRLTPSQLRALHRYVADGGVLLIDACGGSATTGRDLLERVLPGLAGAVGPSDIPPDHPIWLGTFPGMMPLDGKVRPFTTEMSGRRTLPLQSIPVGKGLILFSPVDLTTGLLGTSTWGVNGYAPDAAYAAARNVLLYALEREPPVP